MGKSDEKRTRKRAHKATDGENKHKNKPSFDATTFVEAAEDEERRHSQWRDQFQQLCAYKVQFGDCIVPQQYVTNPKLGKWVSHQRNQYRIHQEGKPSPMTGERIRALNSIAFDWGTSKTDLASIWSVRFQQLCEFKEQTGHCLVPRTYSSNPKLGRWVTTQRNQYRNHQMHQGDNPNPMPEERIQALNVIGFDWGTSNLTWSEHFEQLCEFKEQTGHSLVPRNNPKLGTWVSIQRSKYRLHQKGNPSTMTEERIQALNGIGFDWGTKRTDLVPWSVRFQQLCEYKEQIGHCLVPRTYAANPQLGKWVSVQRHSCRLRQGGHQNPVTEERIRALNGIGFDWGTSQTDLVSIWSLRFQQLSEFKERIGHCLVPYTYSANPDLGRWVSIQRSKYRLQQKGKPSPMTEERIRELDSIGFHWGEARLIGRTI
jgi:hypothetical protein